jgi:hypothetical protein
MGNTCASFHVHWRGEAADVGRAITSAYGKLGWAKTKKALPEGGKTVLLLARAGEPFVSVYDSTQADLDGGELKDAALRASKSLKAGALSTSIYDSDSYEFAVFGNGRQLDLVMSDASSYAGPMKSLNAKTRARQWAAIFGRPLTADQVERAASETSVFADSTLSQLSSLVGLPGDRPLLHYRDLADEPNAGAIALHFVRKAATKPVVETGEIRLRNYYDKDNSRKLLVYPAAWPMPIEREEILTWLLLSEGAGFKGGAMDVEVIGPGGLTISHAFMNGAKFHNGQIVGGYELPNNASLEVANAYLESKRFSFEARPADGDDRRLYFAEYPNLFVPPMTPECSTQILLVLQFHVCAKTAGEWTLSLKLRPGADRASIHELPAVRVAAAPRGWLPIVTGLNPRANYDASDLPDEALSPELIDILTQRSMALRPAAPLSSEQRVALEKMRTEGRDRNYKTWLHDVSIGPRQVAREWRLEQPAIASNDEILAERGQPTLDASRAYLESWLRRLAEKAGEVRVHAERQMTASLHVGKVKKSGPAAGWLADRVWAKFFDVNENYQSIVADYIPEGAEFPVAGMGLALALRHPGSVSTASGLGDTPDGYHAHLLATSLSRMRGRPFPAIAPGGAAHVYEWAINRPEISTLLADSTGDMVARLDAFACENEALQAWHGATAWIPRFDRSSDYEGTVYEDISALNFFRGVVLEQGYGLKDRRMTRVWCANVLRMVAPRLWLCAALFDQLDAAALDRVANVGRVHDTVRIQKREVSAMDDFELSLLPILPIETRRMTVSVGHGGP